VRGMRGCEERVLIVGSTAGPYVLGTVYNNNAWQRVRGNGCVRGGLAMTGNTQHHDGLSCTCACMCARACVPFVCACMCASSSCLHACMRSVRVCMRVWVPLVLVYACLWVGIVRVWRARPRTAPCCATTPQHTTTHPKTPQHTATHRNTPQQTTPHHNIPHHTTTRRRYRGMRRAVVVPQALVRGALARRQFLRVIDSRKGKGMVLRLQVHRCTVVHGLPYTGCCSDTSYYIVLQMVTINSISDTNGLMYNTNTPGRHSGLIFVFTNASFTSTMCGS
jgi:hypothetical protein